MLDIHICPLFIARLDPTEPAGLTFPVYCRIELLKLLLIDKGTQEWQLPNIEAIIRAYRRGDLQAIPGYVSYWRDGNMIRELGPPMPIEKHADLLKPGLSPIWPEDVRYSNAHLYMCIIETADG